ncbi:helix-turn-helix domain-containing protein [Roseovarius pacificus]|uniref:helix-turn-helix domain-containing protein n=1 Tax=Roseovarius pacificus TaxID=337701 RepID=UPI0040393B5B
MRTSFGRFAQELRLKNGLSQKDFSELAGMSMSHVSNLEHQRANVNDDVVGIYIRVLDCTGFEAHELRKRARFSNGVRKSPEPKSPNTPIQVMFSEFGDRISATAREEIQKILERETGERLEALRFSSNQLPRPSRHKTQRNRRPSLSPRRLAEIALLAENARRRVCEETAKVEIGFAIEKLSSENEKLDYEVRDELPQQLDGAFAAIVGHSKGQTILIEEKRFQSAIKGVHFARHVVAHEIAHHYLHAHLLESEKTLWLPPQELAKNTPMSFGSSAPIEQLVDTIEEVEAECFATLFLVPWTAFLKGTESRYLAIDYGEQKKEIERYARFFVLDPVKDAIRALLWENEIYRHIIFDS